MGSSMSNPQQFIKRNGQRHYQQYLRKNKTQKHSQHKVQIRPMSQNILLGNKAQYANYGHMMKQQQNPKQNQASIFYTIQKAQPQHKSLKNSQISSENPVKQTQIIAQPHIRIILPQQQASKKLPDNNVNTHNTTLSSPSKKQRKEEQLHNNVIQSQQTFPTHLPSSKNNKNSQTKTIILSNRKYNINLQKLRQRKYKNHQRYNKSHLSKNMSQFQHKRQNVNENKNKDENQGGKHNNLQKYGSNNNHLPSTLDLQSQMNSKIKGKEYFKQSDNDIEGQANKNGKKIVNQKYVQERQSSTSKQYIIGKNQTTYNEQQTQQYLMKSVQKKLKSSKKLIKISKASHTQNLMMMKKIKTIESPSCPREQSKVQQLFNPKVDKNTRKNPQFNPYEQYQYQEQQINKFLSFENRQKRGLQQSNLSKFPQVSKKINEKR